MTQKSSHALLDSGLRRNDDRGGGKRHILCATSSITLMAAK
jgi:hypothetical protein